jgi:cytochrome c biogenesis protein CcdA
MAKEKLDVVYFYSSKCMACKENKTFIENLSNINEINLITYNTDEIDCSNVQYAYAQHFNVPEEKSIIVPYIYFGTKAYELTPELHNKVLIEINDYLNGSVDYENFKYNDKCLTSPFEKFLEKLTIPGIIIAGLIDGINPCAISILLVFYSFLMMTENKKKILALSTMFITGIFFANFLFGIGIKLFYNLFAGNEIIMYILYGIASFLCLCTIIVNTIDIINTNKLEPKNQLPDKIKYKITNILKNSIFSKFSIFVTLIAGFIIGGIELACTGQIYFPTITYMIQTSGFGLRSICLLIIYNIMFIVPLVTITIIAGVVKKPEFIKLKIMNKNWLIKLISNIFFIVMLIIIIRQIVLI